MNDELLPQLKRPDIKNVSNDTLCREDMLNIVLASIKQEGLAGHNIKGYNELISSGLNHILTKLFDINRFVRNERTQTEDDKKRKSYQIKFQFHSVKVGKPVQTAYISGETTDLYPNESRLSGVPYSAPVTVGAHVSISAIYENGMIEEKSTEVPPFVIGKFPTMVGGINCHTSNCTKLGLQSLGEDAEDPGGYFIAKRGEYVVDLLENIRYNSPHIHQNMKPNEHVRMEFLSQPGGAFENSSQVRLRYMTNGQITIEMNSIKFERVKLPFYIIYRLFGMTNDKTVTETIIFDTENKDILTKNMMEILSKAFHLADSSFVPLMYELNRESLVRLTAERIAKYLSNPTSTITNESAIQFLVEDLLGSPTKPGGLDMVLLPHMGQTSASRVKKLRFIGLMIHRMFLVHFGVLSPTDRDSYRNKRAHGAGVSMAKAFKTQVNGSIVIPILRSIKRELKNNTWESITSKSLVDIFRTALIASDLNRGLEQSITAGSKTIVIQRNAVQNRVSSQMLERKNVLNVCSAMRQVVTQSNNNVSSSTERANIMRRVNPSYIGYICVSQSAESGEHVGMRKQLAITSSVCTAGDATLLKLKFNEDPEIIHLDNVTNEDMSDKDTSRIFINGEWIGICKAAHKFVKRYRQLRREGRTVDPYTSISWDPSTNEIEFWLDVGRLRRPLLIVDNNIEEYKASCREIFEWKKANPGNKEEPKQVEFVQNIRLTQRHIKALKEGAINVSDLVTMGIMEYITPEEQENCLNAQSVVDLFKARNDLTNQYTHCDIEQSIFGLSAHISPFGNHTQPARVTYETNHARQTGGWYANNFPFRTDKNRFFQFYNSVPLISTITTNIVPANGTNVIIAYASYGGDNQEDSAIVAQSSADLQLFAGAFFRNEMAELEKGEHFCTPDPINTRDIKPNANYGKLDNGLIRKGSIVQYGDVIIGRVAKLAKGAADDGGKYIYTDRSVIYHSKEPAIIESVVQPRDVNDEKFTIVKMRYSRALSTGDKMSSRSGNKSIVAKLIPQSDMPFTESGITPDVIINKHSFPSRMTVGQLIETGMGKTCAKRGIIADGTPFLDIDHDDIAKDLYEDGFRYNGCERMYNGMTGEYLNIAIFIGPTTEQRIQKFILDDEQVSTDSGPTDATTGQPLGGKHIQGGLKIGEMEHWCLASHGCMHNVYEKNHTDSDGRILHVCRNCGNPAVQNDYNKRYVCKTCNEFAHITTIDSTKSSALFREELASANARMRLELDPIQYEENLPIQEDST